MLSRTGYFVCNNHWYKNHINTIKKTISNTSCWCSIMKRRNKRKRRKSSEVNRPGNISDYSTTLGPLLNVVI